MTGIANPQVVLLEKRHNRGAFSCGKTALDNYIQQQAGQDVKRRMAAVFVLEEAGQDEILGFYTLSNLSIDPGQLPDEAVKRLPKARPIPCTLLGQFAVSAACQGRGVGDWLLGEILERVYAHSKSQGSFALVVDAVDDGAAAYWRYMGFIPFPDTPHRLFLPMATIEATVLG